MRDRPPVRFAVLGSTRGTALRPVAEAWRRGRLAAEPTVVVSNRAKAPILDYARSIGVPSVALSPRGLAREDFDAAVNRVLREHGSDIVLMIGYMRIVSPWFVEKWRGRLLNIHPSLLPRHGGLMDLDVHRSVLEAGDSESGCTLHLAEEEVDAGRIVLQKKCPVLPGDTPETLRERVQMLEAEAFLDLLSDPARHIRW